MNTSPAPTEVTNLGFDSLAQRAYLNLWRAYDRLKAIEEEVFTADGLSAQQYNTLRLLRSAHPGSMPVLSLGSRLISRAPDMTRLIDRLEQRELVSRQRRPENRRVVEVTITPAGLELLNQLDGRVLELNQRQLGHLSPAELTHLISLLEEVRAPHEPVGGAWCLQRERSAAAAAAAAAAEAAATQGEH